MTREQAFRILMQKIIRRRHKNIMKLKPQALEELEALVFAANDMVDESGGTGDPPLGQTREDLVNELIGVSSDLRRLKLERKAAKSAEAMAAQGFSDQYGKG